MTVDLILFFILALISVISAVSMLLSRNAVYSALFLIINFGTIASFYLMLGAPFLALAQVTVYAGAIMVLFLFVIMLLGAEQLRHDQPIGWQQPLAIILGAVLLIEAGVIALSIGKTGAVVPPFSTLNSEAAGPMAIGTALFNQYLLPFEITSVLLLVAMIGAIVLSKTEKRAR